MTTPRKPTQRPASRRVAARRGVALGAAALLAFVGGAIAGSRHEPADQRVVGRFARAWERGDYAVMYSLVRPSDQAAIDVVEFARAYRSALATATAAADGTGIRARPGPLRHGASAVAVRIPTRVFGVVSGTVSVPVADTPQGPRVAWSRALTFPGLSPGQDLSRQAVLGRRAALLAREGSVLAKGDGRASGLPSASAIVGQLGPIPQADQERYDALGYPRDAKVGLTGLERVFEQDLAGVPGGRLLAGSTVIAQRAPRPGKAVRTSIDPNVQAAAVAALGDRLGGVAALDPRNGEILGLAGIAFSGLQPPGSTFKIVTASAALDSGAAKLSSTFPVQTGVTIEGREIENANGESCGGTLLNAFAVSCNSVFAPLGVTVGAQRLVATARRFGFGEDPGITGAATSTIPAANEIADDLELAATAIGQGRVQASALQMATVAATIGMRGERPRVTLRRGQRRAPARAIPKKVARQVVKLMLAVVRGGTGTAAAIPGVPVAGKTGTAELEDTSADTQQLDANGNPLPQATNDPTDTDAWFAAFAPAGRPRVAVGVLLVRAGAGGDTAAPAARTVLLAALKR